MGPLRQAPGPLLPVRGHENSTTIAGHRLLRPLDSTNTAWEVEGEDGGRCILRVADELRGGETRGGRRAAWRRLRTRAALEHPNLLPVVGGGDTERGPYTLLRLPEARPLSAIIAQDALDPRRTVELLGGVAEALDLANSQGLFHLELSPHNILVEDREGGRALLMDFGVTPEVSRVRVGLTPDYRSPEDLRHLPPERASNLYSLACVAWACLTGHAPFVRRSPVAVSYAHTSDPPPKLTADCPDLPPQVDKVMAKALAKEPGDRYGSSVAFVRALGRAMGVQSTNGASPAAPPSEPGSSSNGRAAAPAGPPAVRPPEAAPRVTRRPEPDRRPAPAPGSAASAPAPAPEVTAPRPTPVRPAARPAPKRERPATPRRERPARPAPSPTAELRPAPEPSPLARRGLAKHPVALLAMALALVAGAAGWLLGTEPAPEPARPDTAGIARAQAATTAVQQRNVWRAQADRAIARLDSRRASGRRLLRAARTRRGQALRARQLAGAFGGTAGSLRAPPASFEAGAALEPALRRAERAYRSLAAAAASGRGFRSASAAVARSESGLNRAIGALDAGLPAG